MYFFSRWLHKTPFVIICSVFSLFCNRYFSFMPSIVEYQHLFNMFSTFGLLKVLFIFIFGELISTYFSLALYNPFLSFSLIFFCTFSSFLAFTTVYLPVSFLDTFFTHVLIIVGLKLEGTEGADGAVCCYCIISRQYFLFPSISLALIFIVSVFHTVLFHLFSVSPGPLCPAKWHL